jgi:hypothetical protein
MAFFDGCVAGQNLAHALERALHWAGCVDSDLLLEREMHQLLQLPPPAALGLAAAGRRHAAATSAEAVGGHRTHEGWLTPAGGDGGRRCEAPPGPSHRLPAPAPPRAQGSVAL